MKRKFNLVLLCCAIAFASHAADRSGYIVTRDGKRITGKIDKIFYSDLYSELTFINDMGTAYVIAPALIRGFMYEDETGIVCYESKYRKGKWLFLKVIHKGGAVNLYMGPEKKTYFSDGVFGLKKYSLLSEEYWVEFAGETPFKIYRVGFRKKMRKKMKDIPEIASKIGTQGYRYKNILFILKEYNDLKSNSKMM